MIRILAILLGLGVAACSEGGPLLCGGDTSKLSYALGGNGPHASVEIDGRDGNFLIDYGATQSSLSRSEFPGRPAPLTTSFGLPSFPTGRFQLRDYGSINAPRGGRIGVIGTDFLSLLTAEFDFDAGKVGLSAEDCSIDPAASGFAAFSQTGRFSSNEASLGGGVNVPVLPLNIGGMSFEAQIDSGYGDTLYRHSMDVNRALFDALQASGIEMKRVGGVDIVTCAGRESREVWKIEQAKLVDDTGRMIAAFQPVHIIPKAPNACGGIASSNQPKGQLGASFLHTLGHVIFDPRNERVWIAGSQ